MTPFATEALHEKLFMQWLGVTATIKVTSRPNSVPYLKSGQNIELNCDYSNLTMNMDESLRPWSNKLDRAQELDALLGPTSSSNNTQHSLC